MQDYKMKELDVVQFWKDDGIAHGENCFAKEAPQVALGISMSAECFGAELGVELNPWLPNPPELMQEYAKRYNDKAEEIVGKRLVFEDYSRWNEAFPQIKRIGEFFGGRYFFKEGSEYLEGSVKTFQDLEKLLDDVEKIDVASFAFPSDWDRQIKDIYEKTGHKPEPRYFGRHIRGPCTLAASIMGVENFIFLWYDEPDLVRRFSVVIGDVIIKLNKAIDAACGYNEQNKPHGFSFADDNCCLTTPEFYEAFGYPVLKRVFEYWSPDEGDSRYQHSDSDMGHLLPVLGRLDFTGVNFGPKVYFDEIRKNMPKARIDGCIAPFVFMRNQADEIVSQVKRDCKMAIESGTRGLNLATAGSVNPGSSLASLRLVMQTIQNFGRYKD
jgi:uroporphyrinogen decarboxylase